MSSYWTLFTSRPLSGPLEISIVTQKLSSSKSFKIASHPLYAPFNTFIGLPIAGMTVSR